MLSYTKSRLAGKILLQTLLFFLIVTQIGFGQWASVGLNDESIKDIAARNSIIFAVTSDSGKLYRSTDDGNNWTTIFELGVIDIDVSPSGDVFMVKDSIYNSGPPQLFRSSDTGSSWIYSNVREQIADSHVTSGPNNVEVSPIGTIFCSLYYSWRNGSCSIIGISTDNGTTWTGSGWEAGGLYDFKGNSVLTVGFGCEPTTCWSSISLSDDGGFQWINLIDASMACTALKLCLNGNILLGGLFGGQIPQSGIFLSSDSCNTWVQVSFVLPQCGLSLPFSGLLAGTDSSGVFLFSDNGDSLGSRNDGLTNLNIHTLTIDNNDYVYAGTDNGVWRRPLSEITSVEEEQIDEILTEFLLSQNYPNPFNPQTSIQYAISSRQFVTLKVYDILGNEIETLVNEEKPAGSYELTWYPENLPSGVYFYQMQAGSFIQTMKMLLLK